MTWTRRGVLSTGLAALFCRPTLAADAYPAHPLRFIVPQPPGGGNDALARVIAQKLAEQLGQQVVVDNRGGASGMIAAQMAAKSPPDGYTLFLGQTQTLAVNPHLYSDIAYDPQRDFAPISLIASIPLVLLVHPSVPARSVTELVSLAMASPGRINFASAGNGSGAHLAGELFKLMTRTDITHVPYKGTGPALTDLLAGQVQMFFSTLPSAVPHIQAGTVRALAVTGPTRSPALPDIPTVAEAGVPGFAVALHYGILTTAGTPQPVVARLNQEIRRVLQDPTVENRLAGEGAEPLTSTPEEFAADIAAELAKWGQVVRESGAHID
ncbi:MAG TPA: tripartite tricarboxylate transporter substrate binding protein [Alphaproteobacteria bacterium]